MADAEDLLDKIDRVAAAVEKIKDGTVDDRELEELLRDVGVDKRKQEEERRKREAEERKRVEQERILREGRPGTGIAEDCKYFCPACRWEYLKEDLSTCAKCGGKLQTRIERKAELDAKVKALMEEKSARKERRERFAAWQEARKKQRQAGVDYEGWDFWEPESDDEDNFIPPSDPAFAALEADFKARAERRKEARNKACELKDKGNEHFKNNRLEEAIKCYSDAIHLHRSEKAFYTNRAACFLKLRKWGEAVKDCSTVIEIFNYMDNRRLEPAERTAPTPVVFKAFMRRAEARRSLKAYQLALEDVTEALKLRPTQKDALQLKAQLEADILEVEREQQVLEAVKLSMHESQKEKEDLARQGIDYDKCEDADLAASPADLSGSEELTTTSAGTVVGVLSDFVKILRFEAERAENPEPEGSQSASLSKETENPEFLTKLEKVRSLLELSDANRAVMLHLGAVPLFVKYVEREFGSSPQASDNALKAVLETMVAFACHPHARDDIANSGLLTPLGRAITQALLPTNPDAPESKNRVVQNVQVRAATWSLMRALSEYSLARSYLVLESVHLSILQELENGLPILRDRIKPAPKLQAKLDTMDVFCACVGLLGNLCFDPVVRSKYHGTSIISLVVQLLATTLEIKAGTNSSGVRPADLFSLQRSCLQVITNAWGDAVLRKELKTVVAEMIPSKSNKDQTPIQVNAVGLVAVIVTQGIDDFIRIELTGKLVKASVEGKTKEVTASQQLSVLGESDKSLSTVLRNGVSLRLPIKSASKEVKQQDEHTLSIFVASTESVYSDRITEGVAYLINATLDPADFKLAATGIDMVTPFLHVDNEELRSRPGVIILLHQLTSLLMRVPQLNTSWLHPRIISAVGAVCTSLPLVLIERTTALIARLIHRETSALEYFIQTLGGQRIYMALMLSIYIMTLSRLDGAPADDAPRKVPIHLTSLLENVTRGLVACIANSSDPGFTIEFATFNSSTKASGSQWLASPDSWMIEADVNASRESKENGTSLPSNVLSWFTLSASPLLRVHETDLSPIALNYALNLAASLAHADGVVLSTQAKPSSGAQGASKKILITKLTGTGLLAFLVRHSGKLVAGNAALAISRIANLYLAEKSQEATPETSGPSRLNDLPAAFERAKLLDGLFALLRSGDENAGRNAATAAACLARMSPGLLNYIRENDGFRLLQQWANKK